MSLGEVKLTPREWEVVEFLMLELSDAEIARQMGIGYEGVKHHLRNIRAKLDVINRVGIVMRVTEMRQKQERESFNFQSH